MARVLGTAAAYTELGTLGIDFRARKPADEAEWRRALARMTRTVAPPA